MTNESAHRAPDGLETFSRVYFAAAEAAYRQLSTEKEDIALDLGSATSGRFFVKMFNSLRKSLRYWAPSDQLTKKIDSITAVYDKEAGVVRLWTAESHINLEHRLSAQIPDFDRAYKNVKKVEYMDNYNYPVQSKTSVSETSVLDTVADVDDGTDAATDYMTEVFNAQKT